MASDRITLLVGTTKGLFIVSGGPGRSGWATRGPFCDGWTINHATGDAATGTLWAGGGNDFTGAGVWRSDDGGSTWALTRLTRGRMDDWAESEPDLAERIGHMPGPLPFGDAFTQVWSLAWGHGTLWAGTKPARLLASRDGGATWAEVESLARHPSAETWFPGAAGLTLHTIVLHPGDPAKLWLGISAAGVFASEDGGATWERRNRLSNAEACGAHDHPAGPRDGETGHCVHNMVRADRGGDMGRADTGGDTVRADTGGDTVRTDRRGDTGGDLLYQQNHHGVWRSSDGGRSWDDITPGLPSTFGFPIHVHPRDPATIWTLPLNGDSAGRFPPDAACAVWRSRDGGAHWEAQRSGLPQEDCYFTVLRQAMTGDAADPAGVYFGTNSGAIFASRDEGETWSEIRRHLPTILSLEVLARA
jgi:photosystem II stability/assembly factor-like uncharacterized protein